VADVGAAAGCSAAAISTPEQYARFKRDEYERAGEIVKTANIKLN
jgi:hypothetical protein